MKLRACVCLIVFLTGTVLGLPFALAGDDSNYQTGSVTNSCNGELNVTFISRTGEENSKTLMPNQSAPVPPNTVVVKAELMDDVYGDETTTVEILMPDGSTHVLQSLPGSVRIP